jgi:hypothetical protein
MRAPCPKSEYLKPSIIGVTGLSFEIILNLSGTIDKG